MSPLFGADKLRTLVQGVTGGEGSYWTEQMLAYGTQVVGGCTPGKGGQEVHGVPVFSAVGEAIAEHAVDLSVIFVPARFAKGAALEAIEAGVPNVIVLAEFVPVHDTMEILAAARANGTRIIGPNCPGIVFPDRDFAGIMPAWSDRLFSPGRVGVVSRSGSLGALINLNLVGAGLGQSAFLGLGGDPIVGTTFAQALQLFEADPDTDSIILLGEVGGPMEEEAAELIGGLSKPVVAFIAGKNAPEGKKMGHAGALVSGGKGTAASKMAALASAGARVAETPTEIIDIVANV
ncbi:MAG: succinate--CoA ligase subunit alpha [Actinomycetota bacterium]